MVESYKGIKDKYPKLPLRFAGYIQLMRPFTILIPIVVAFLIMGIERLYSGYTIISSPFMYRVILAGLSMGFLHVVGQVSNQICDGVEYDKACGKDYRPLVTGIVDENGAWSVVFISLIIGLVIGFYVSEIYGYFLSILLFMAVFNNLDPIRTKKRFGLNEIWLGLSRGFFPVVAFWSIFGDLHLLPILIGITAFLYVLSTNWVKDIGDEDGDSEFGIITIPVKYDDLRPITNIMINIHVITILIIAYLVVVYDIAFIGLLSFVVFAVWINSSIAKGQIKDSEKMENSHQWVAFYVGILMGYLTTFLFIRFIV